MKHKNANAANRRTGLKRREFMAMLAGCSVGLMAPSISHGEKKMASSQMPVNPAAPHYESFVTHVMTECVRAGIGVLAMKTLADGRFFGGNRLNSRNASTRWSASPARIASSTRTEFPPRGKERKPD